MNKVIQVVLFLIVLASAFLTSARPTFACSCPPSPPPLETLHEADVVVAARVTDVPDTPAFDFFYDSAELTPITVEVSRVWKGSTTQSLTVRSERLSTSCGFPFEEGKEYLIYATSRGGPLRTRLCSRTAILANVGEDLALLGEGQEPEQPARPPAPATPFRNWGTVAVLLVLGISGAIIAWKQQSAAKGMRSNLSPSRRNEGRG